MHLVIWSLVKDHILWSKVILKLPKLATLKFLVFLKYLIITLMMSNDVLLTLVEHNLTSCRKNIFLVTTQSLEYFDSFGHYKRHCSYESRHRMKRRQMEFSWLPPTLTLVLLGFHYQCEGNQPGSFVLWLPYHEDIWSWRESRKLMRLFVILMDGIVSTENWNLILNISIHFYYFVENKYHLLLS